MCLVVPGKVVEVRGSMCTADFAGEKKDVSLQFVDAKQGDYIICAGDVATDKIPEWRAKEMLEIFNADNK
ncbi:MAG: HypC/HybG/HupF family hydrogenase formation chaperone [Candidatus Aenigmatarchaeota archaeon]|nr:HypC/HybG/HupF family hydrogenase formation chaperone [Nanoarchaeota archaeon]